MLYNVLIGIHVFACLFLIGVVLLQTGKGADMGAVFGGGSSDTVFGSSGAGNFLTKLTTGVAVLFMITSLVMTYGLARQTSQSLFDEVDSSGPAASSEDETIPVEPDSNESMSTSAAPPAVGTDDTSEDPPAP